jgi:tRNA A-37 threonylcarbamoyl transferase component Bud32
VDPPTTASLLDRLRRVLAPQYTVERELASGGMGVVFLGTDTLLDRRVAIKVLRPEFTFPAASQRFTREARLLAKLQHPNIVAVHQAGEADGIQYFVMDYVNGRTLADRLTEGPFPPDAVVALGRDLLSALEAAHKAGVTHRDVKPANVFLVGDRVLLADFGVASVGDTTDPSDTTLTSSGQLIGTPAYMSPEQLSGAHASPRTDLYGVGLVLYEACTGRRWPPASDPEHGDWGSVPPNLRQALRRALALSPASRWPDAATFRRALERRVVPVLLPAAAVALLVLALVWWWDHRSLSDAPRLRTDLAVVPFTKGGADDPAGLRLARYVGNELEWFPGWRLTSVPTSFAWWASRPPDARALEAPDALRTRFYAGGELLDGGRRLQVSIRDSTGAPYYRLSIVGDPADLLGWSGAIADSIARTVFPHYLEEFRDLAARGPHNVQAYTELFAGQEAFRHDDLAGAEARYSRALELDPSFAQAAWELALTRRWRDHSFANAWRQLYEQHRDRLPELQQQLIVAGLEPNLPARFAALQAAVQRYPSKPEGMLVWADELYHRGSLAEIPLDSALRVMEAVAAREPYLTAYLHTALGQIRLGHEADAHRALEELERRRSATVTEAHRRARLVALVYDARFHPWRARLKLRWLTWRADSAAIVTLAQYVRLGLLFDAPEAQRRVGELLARKGPTAQVRANGHEAQGLALMAEGQPQAAVAQFDSAATMLGTPDAEIERAEWRLLPPALGLPRADSASVGWARATLSAASTGPAAARAAWALAVDAVTTGDSAAIVRWRSLLEALARTTPSALGLEQLVAALVAGRRGDPAAAIAGTDSLLVQGATSLAQAPFARAVLYLHRGEWLAASGAADRADRTWLWYEAWDVEGWATRGAEAGEIDAVAGGVARLRRAALAAEHGDRATACRYATRVRQLWANAEASYAPLIQRADSLAADCGS